jgi:pyruvate dehydrogenase E2 component (dihydrolipoamide acetyltransferase)
MATYVTMPKLGLTMTEGTVTEWDLNEGDNVKKGQVIAKVATDKLNYEVEAPEDGTLLKIFVQAGVSVPVGENLAVIGNAGEKVEEISSVTAEPETREEKVEKQEETAEVQKPEPEKKIAGPVSTGPVKASPLAKKWARIFGLSLEDIAGSGPEGRIGKDDVMNEAVIFKASPLAKKMASENGLDITEIPGTGPGGRTVKEDVIRFIEEGRGKPKASPVAVKLAEELGVDLASIDKDGRIMKEDVLAAAGVSEEAEVEAPAMPSTPSEQAGGEKRVPLSTMRKVIAERMTQSAQTIPSVVFNVEVDFTEIIAFRNRIKEQIAASGAKLSFNDILMKICSRVLTEHPMANASYDKDSSEYILHSDVNIGLAVAVEGGLLVPNVKSVQNKSLQEIASETDSLVEKSRKGTLSMDDLQGGTFTISNLGMFGMHDFTPIINPPEACILAVNAIEEKPVVRNGEIVIRPISNLGLTADHRILDGADAAKFLARIRELIENPYLLLV